MNYPLSAPAQSIKLISSSLNQSKNRLAKLKFPNNGAPVGRRRGGARREVCPSLDNSLDNSLTALVPGEDSEVESKSFLALTVSEYPTFWIYLPKFTATVTTGQFSLQDENNKDIYRKSLTLPNKSGVIGFKLPQNARYALKVNQKYQWYFKVSCNEAQKKPRNYYVYAWITRIEMTSNLDSQLKSTKPREYITYAENQIWESALTNLADLRLSNANLPQLREDWTGLLESVGLGEFSQAPIQRYQLEE
ncbi:hypothetical protein DSM106972_094050 [Dulcicalothrix desertica PCC 7102]|uniref:DUF928 domain-containing protein n=1 Tax=Dulcicalothrix desertica PCC 7102 TaxID=232991 RepID=A0A3S5K2W5_9CYAN|nr:DUF928 domain-containing protein [Dulcicalothrix desertica]RUS94208.1 hypothetical protein DSM106972_094050 [Dulcicalothrix desertica PCC 7102]